MIATLEANLQIVQGRIAAAALRSGREPAEITLVAVTKTQSPQIICAAYELGLRHFGENRVEEAEEKIEQLPVDITWHMIGHIQSRKVKRVVPCFDIIHSLDSAKLASRLDRLSADLPVPLPVLLEFNISGEPSKYGFSAQDWEQRGPAWDSLLAEVEKIVALPHLRIDGLMTMAPVSASAEDARPVFRSLRMLRGALAAAFPKARWHHLSMGMTDDFDVAIEEGATIVRVGRAIFAPHAPSWCNL